MPFQILVDTVQQRVKLDSISTLCGADDWNIASSNAVYQDGITGQAFLCPAYFYLGQWLTSNTGIYAKLPPTDYTLTPVSTDPGWTFPAVNADGAQWCKFSNNTTGAGGITTYELAANQAMVVEMSQQNQTGNNDEIGRVGWSNTGLPSAGVALIFYRDNSADIYIGGAFEAHYTMSGQVSDYGQSKGQISYQSSNPYVTFLLIPCRERELLVISSIGGGFSHVFSSIPEGTSNPIITPAEAFWWGMQPGIDSQFRCALCQFAGSGSLVGKRSFWRTDPGSSPTGGFQSYIDGLTPTGTSYSLSVADGVTPSSPYSNNANGVCLNLTLTGSSQTSGPYSPTITPFVFGARGYTVPETANTVGPPLDVTTYATSLSFTSSDSVSGTRCVLTVKDPKAIAAAGLALNSNNPGINIDILSERPWQIYDDDGTQFLEGLNEPPKFHESTFVQDSATNSYGTDSNLVESVSLDIRDGFMVAENFLFKDIIPADGLSIAAFFQLLSLEMGWASPILSSDLSTTYMPQAGNPTSKFNTQIEPGDKGADWIDRIVKTQCGNYFCGMVPAGSMGQFQLQVLAEADLPSTPAVTLYDSRSTAIANGVSDPTYLQIFRSVDVQMLRPEANDIYVQGYDYRTRRPILVHKEDSVNMDPTVIPRLRTPAWRGARISYTWIDPTLADVDACIYAMGLLFPRLTPARSLIEIEADFYGIAPRGSLMKLYFASGGGIKDPTTGNLTNPVTCRVKAVNAGFHQVLDDGTASKWRPTKYVLQMGTDASNLNTHSHDIEGIKAEWMLRSVSKSVQWGDALDAPIWTRPLIQQAEA